MALFSSSWPKLPLASGKFQFDNGGPQLNALQISVGTVTLNSGTPVTVANTAVTASSQIMLTLKTVGGTVAAPYVATITPGTGFTVNGGGSDTSVYNYAILG